MNRSASVVLSMVLLASALAVVPASANPFIWDGSRTSENWDNVGPINELLDTNWNQPLAIPGAPDTVTFPGGAFDSRVKLNGNRSVQSVFFSGDDDYSLFTELSTETLTLGTGDITTSGTATKHSINCDVTMEGSASGDWTVGNPLLTVVGDISSSAFGLTKKGSGTLKLIGDDDTSSDFCGR